MGTATLSIPPGLARGGGAVRSRIMSMWLNSLRQSLPGMWGNWVVTTVSARRFGDLARVTDVRPIARHFRLRFAWLMHPLYQCTPAATTGLGLRAAFLTHAFVGRTAISRFCRFGLLSRQSSHPSL